MPKTGHHHGPTVTTLINSFGFTEPVNVAEIGVWKGYLSRYIFNHCQNARLWMVDAYGQGRDRVNYVASEDGCASVSQQELTEAMREAIAETQGFSNRRTIALLDSLEFANQCKANGTRFDLVFIDADHTYEAVKSDIEAFTELLTDRGILSGHDYMSPKDRRGLWGVKKAVDEYAIKNNLAVRLGHGKVWWYEKRGVNDS